MINIIKICVILFFLFGSSSSFSKSSSNVDAFHACMSRTKQDRVSCEEGCGMIIQQCYDEGVAEVDKKINELLVNIKNGGDEICENFSISYLNRASNMEREISRETENLPGWTGAELNLNLARQRLDNIRLIRESCKQ